MEIGKVVGSVVSVSKIQELRPVKMFLVQVLDSEGCLKDDFITAIDAIGVGPDDIVIITQGSGARFTEISKPTHTDAAIVARIDNISL